MPILFTDPSRDSRKGRAAVSAAIIAVSLALGACGGGGGGAGASQGTGSSQPPPSGGTTTNRAPTIGGTPATVTKTSAAYYFQPTASDPDGDSLTFRIGGKPSWATFNTSNGALYGTPGDTAAGTYSGIQIIASDGKAETALPTFSITVSPPVIGSATLSWQPPTQNEDGTPLTDLAGYIVRYGKNPGNLDLKVTLSSPSATTVVIDNLIEGTWFFTLSSVNASGIESRPTGAVSKIIG